MRYVYLGHAGTAPRWRDQPCDPVLDARGKCIVGRGNQLVRFADGSRVVVARRRLRLRRYPNPAERSIRPETSRTAT